MEVRPDNATGPVSESELERYTRNHRQFMAEAIPPMLERTLLRGPSKVLVDLGCGDGWLVSTMLRLSPDIETIYAVDLAAERVNRASLIDARVKGFVADATHVDQLPAGSVDAVVVSQVIEHIPDDKALAPEIARLLRPGGWWYVGSAMRGPRAWWFYRKRGSWLLDPTHEREYRSKDEFAEALAHPDLELEVVETRPIRFPVIELALRAASTAHLVQAGRLANIYDRQPGLTRFRAARIRAPGYHTIEAVGRRR